MSSLEELHLDAAAEVDRRAVEHERAARVVLRRELDEVARISGLTWLRQFACIDDLAELLEHVARWHSVAALRPRDSHAALRGAEQ